MRSAAASYRLALLLALGTALFLALGAGALGIIGDGRADGGYLAVLAVLFLGSLVARFRARGMAVALLATAATQVLVPVVVLRSGAVAAGEVSLVDVAGLTLMYAGLFTLSAWLFRRAAGRQPSTPVARRA